MVLSVHAPALFPGSPAMEQHAPALFPGSPAMEQNRKGEESLASGDLLYSTLHHFLSISLDEQQSV